MHLGEACATTAVQAGRTLSLVKSRASRARVANTLTSMELPTAKNVLKVPIMTDLALLRARNAGWAGILMCLAWPLASCASLGHIQIKAGRKGVSNALKAQLHTSLGQNLKIHAGFVPIDAMQMQ
jgi:hypothetical protein